MKKQIHTSGNIGTCKKKIRELEKTEKRMQLLYSFTQTHIYMGCPYKIHSKNVLKATNFRKAPIILISVLLISS